MWKYPQLTIIFPHVKRMNLQKVWFVFTYSQACFRKCTLAQVEAHPTFENIFTIYVSACEPKQNYMCQKSPFLTVVSERKSPFPTFVIISWKYLKLNFKNLILVLQRASVTVTSAKNCCRTTSRRGFQHIYFSPGFKINHFDRRQPLMLCLQPARNMCSDHNTLLSRYGSIWSLNNADRHLWCTDLI